MICPTCAQVFVVNSAELASKGVTLVNCTTCGAVYRVRLEAVGAPKVPKSLLARVMNRPR